MALVLSIDDVKRCLPKRKRELLQKIEEHCRALQLELDLGYAKAPTREAPLPFRPRKRA